MKKFDVLLGIFLMASLTTIILKVVAGAQFTGCVPFNAAAAEIQACKEATK